MCAIVVHVILYKQTNKQTNKQCSVVKSFLLGHIVSLGMVSVGSVGNCGFSGSSYQWLTSSYNFRSRDEDTSTLCCDCYFVSALVNEDTLLQHYFPIV